MGLLTTLRFIAEHPLNAGHTTDSLVRFIRWQVGCRLLPGSAVAMPFVNNARLLVTPGMTGATGNIYTGLHEFEDMAFLLHLLRKEDLFVDIGANVGSYTVLAGAVTGARCLSFEPVPSTYDHLLDNISLNRISDHVTPFNIGLGREKGTLRFTSGLDTVNHVITSDEDTGAFIEVPVFILDEIVGDEAPTIIKIDVEGFETEVLEGAATTLSSSSLLCVIMELNGSGKRYGHDDAVLHQNMLDLGFHTFSYQPFRRELLPLDGGKHSDGNTLYLKNMEEITERLKSSPTFTVLGQQI